MTGLSDKAGAGAPWPPAAYRRRQALHYHWLLIAVRSEEEAWVAHRKPDPGAEMQAALVGITAAAAAMEAMVDILPRHRATKAHERVVGALAGALELKVRNELRQLIRRTFSWRVNAVHFRSDWQPAEEPPSGAESMFTAQHTSDAVQAAMELIVVGLNARPRTAAGAMWQAVTEVAAYPALEARVFIAGAPRPWVAPPRAEPTV